MLDEVLQQRSLLAGSGVLAVVSGAIALLTYFGMMLHNMVGARMYTVVEVRERDPLYHWLLDWLADQREVYDKGSRVFAELLRDCQKVSQEKVSVRFFPNDDGSMYWFVFSGAFIWLGHHRTEDPAVKVKGFRAELRLRITVLGRSKRAVHDLFQAAFEHKKAKLGGRTEVFVAQPGEHAERSHWRRLEPRRVRPLSIVITSSDPGPQELLADMRQFLAREDWYAERGVPYRRGYLLHGPPGCGKTTFVTAAAGDLECPIYILNLAEPYLSDLALLKLVTDAQPRSILLMEDVDAAFGASRPVARAASGQSQRDGVAAGLLTFSGLLNALDGVAGQEGKIVVMTTNHLEHLDGALVRPGRADVRVGFHRASRAAIAEIFLKFYEGSALGAAELGLAAHGFAAKCADGVLPMATVQGHLMQYNDDPKAAASAEPPVAGNDNDVAYRQFIVPSAPSLCGEGEEE